MPTEYVDNIPKSTEPKIKTFKIRKDVDYSNMNENDPLFYHIIMKKRIKEARELLTLKKWLNKNFEDALAKYELNRPVREEISRLRKSLIEQWGLSDVRWECGWNETHFRGCLQSFKALADHHQFIMYVLRGMYFLIVDDDYLLYFCFRKSSGLCTFYRS